MLARRAALLLGCLSAAARAQEPAPAAALELPALTPVFVTVESDIASNRNHPGDRFPIALAEAVRVDGRVVMPAGARGEGEVIHAAKAGAGGKAGELILAARFVRVAGREIRLRSMQLGAAGKDHTGGALATSFVAGPFAMFVRGGQLVIPAGTLASARTAEAVTLPALAAENTGDTNSHEGGGVDEHENR